MYGIQPSQDSKLLDKDKNKFVDKCNARLTDDPKEMYLSMTRNDCRYVIEYSLPIHIIWNIVEVPDHIAALVLLLNEVD